MRTNGDLYENYDEWLDEVNKDMNEYNMLEMYKEYDYAN